MLLHSVRELEGQLPAEHLLLRGRKLEGEVARHIALKGRMCARINELTKLLLSPSAADTPPPLVDDRPPAGGSSSRTTTTIRREEEEEEEEEGGGGRTLVPGLCEHDPPVNERCEGARQ